MSGLTYIKLKTARAKVHLQELERKLREFIENNPYSITSKDDEKKSLHIIRFELKRMPTVIPMLIGEFAYSLRSGLDQLAWQLALLNVRGRRPHWFTSFPIGGGDPNKTEGFRNATKDILPIAIPVIKALQPYHRGTLFQDDPLWRLDELCKIDKHRILAVHSVDANFRISGVRQRDLRRSDFHYGVKISVPLAAKSKVKVYPKMSEVIFGEPIDGVGTGFEIRIATLRTIHKFVRNDVIPRFARFF